MSSNNSSEASDDEPEVQHVPKSAHPKVSEMVNSALDGLKDRKGSSLQAIKKYIGNNYEANPEKLAIFIKKYLKTAVANGDIIQMSGKGATGSFKLPKKGSSSGEKPPTLVNPTSKNGAAKNVEGALALNSTRVISTPLPKQKTRKKLYSAGDKGAKGGKKASATVKATNSKTSDKPTKTKPTKKPEEPKTKPTTAPKGKAEPKKNISKQVSKNQVEEVPKAKGKPPKEKETKAKATKQPSKKQSKAVKENVAQDADSAS